MLLHLIGRWFRVIVLVAGRQPMEPTSIAERAMFFNVVLIFIYV